MSTISIGTISNNVNTVTISDGSIEATAPQRSLFLTFVGGNYIRLGVSEIFVVGLVFQAGKIGNGGRFFEVTVTVNRALGSTGVSLATGTSANVSLLNVVPRGNQFDVVLQLDLANATPNATIALALNDVEDQPSISGTAQFTSTTGPFVAPAAITWSVPRAD